MSDLDKDIIEQIEICEEKWNEFAKSQSNLDPDTQLAIQSLAIYTISQRNMRNMFIAKLHEKMEPLLEFLEGLEEHS